MVRARLRLFSPVGVLLALVFGALLGRQDRAEQPERRQEESDDEEHHPSPAVGGEADGEDDRNVDKAEQGEEDDLARTHTRSSPSGRRRMPAKIARFTLPADRS